MTSPSKLENIQNVCWFYVYAAGLQWAGWGMAENQATNQQQAIQKITAAKLPDYM
jgi:hypothetical protein